MAGHIPPFDEWPPEVRRWIVGSLGKRAGDTLYLNTTWLLDSALLGQEFLALRRKNLSMGKATRMLAAKYGKTLRHLRRILVGLGLRGEGGDRVARRG